MIDVQRRLRRAILLNDLSLVKRIISNNRKTLRNPDFDDRSNTSLHLAAKHGFTSIAEYLVDEGHEDGMISRNNDWETPLMLAAMAGKEECGVYLAKRFPACVGWKNKAGLDALMLACKSGAGTLHLIPTLIVHGPNILSACDNQGNTALHHASAAGELKAMRMLLQYGANPLASNSYSWTPVHYSATSAAEAYFKTLIIEFEKKKAEGKRAVAERERQRNAGVRLVTDAEGSGSTRIDSAASFSSASGRMSGDRQRNRDDAPPRMSGDRQRNRDDAPPRMSGDRQRAREDAVGVGLPAPGMEWSPVEKRALTPTEGRMRSDGRRSRADTGEST